MTGKREKEKGGRGFAGRASKGGTRGRSDREGKGNLMMFDFLTREERKSM